MGTISFHSKPEFLSDRNKKHNFSFPPTYRCFVCNMERIGLTASEEMSFENVDGRRRTDDGYLCIL